MASLDPLARREFLQDLMETVGEQQVSVVLSSHLISDLETLALNNCLTSHGIRVAVSYQPVSRYWPLQFAETGLFLALVLVLAWYCLWRLNRRLS